MARKPGLGTKYPGLINDDPYGTLALLDQLEREREERKKRQERLNERSARAAQDIVRNFGNFLEERKAIEQDYDRRRERDLTATRGVSNALTPEMEARRQQAAGVNRAPNAYQTYMMQVINSQPRQEETRSTDELRREMNRQNRLANATNRMAADMGNQALNNQGLIFDPVYTSNLRTMGQTMETQQAKAAAATNLYQTVSTRRRAEEEREKYASLMQKPDFAAKSQGDAKIADKGPASSYSEAELLYKNIFHRNDGYKEQDALSVSPAQYLTDEEAATFFYLWNTQGAKAAKAYYDGYVENRASARKAEAVQGQAAAYGAYDPWGASVASVGTNLVSGIGMIDIAYQNLVRAIGLEDRNKPINYNSGAMMPALVTDSLREGVTDYLEKRYPNAKIGNSVNVASFLYQTGMSMADSSVAILLNTIGVPEAATLGMMGAAAGTRAIRNARERGASDGQALAFGISSAIMEALFEKISLDRILTESNAHNLAQSILGTLKQGFTESSEEVMTTLANTVADQFIMGDKSELFTRQRRLMEQGVSEKEALGAAFKQWGTEIMGDAIGGFLSGAGMGGVKEFSNARNNPLYQWNMPMSEARALNDLERSGLPQDRGITPELQASIDAAMRAQNEREIAQDRETLEQLRNAPPRLRIAENRRNDAVTPPLPQQAGQIITTPPLPGNAQRGAEGTGADTNGQERTEEVPHPALRATFPQGKAETEERNGPPLTQRVSEESQTLGNPLWTKADEGTAEGWNEQYTNSAYAFMDALKATDPALYEAYRAENPIDRPRTKGQKQPITNATNQLQDLIRAGAASPMAAATYLSERFHAGTLESIRRFGPEEIADIERIDEQHSAANPVNDREAGQETLFEESAGNQSGLRVAAREQTENRESGSGLRIVGTNRQQQKTAQQRQLQEEGNRAESLRDRGFRNAGAGETVYVRSEERWDAEERAVAAALRENGIEPTFVTGLLQDADGKRVTSLMDGEKLAIQADNRSQTVQSIAERATGLTLDIAGDTLNENRNGGLRIGRQTETSPAAEAGGGDGGRTEIPFEERQRFSGQRAGEQAGGLGQGAENGQPVFGQVRKASSRRSYAEAHGKVTVYNRGSGKSLGIRAAAESSKSQIASEKQVQEDEELREISEAFKQATGLPVSFTFGTVKLANGREARGVYTGKRFVVQCDDDTYTATQLAMHELYHYFADKNPGLNAKLKERILKANKGQALDEVMQTYINELGPAAGLSENMSKKAYDKAIDKILEEVFADAYAGINDYGARAGQFNEEARQTERDFRSSENAAATAQRTGPPEKKSAASLKKDLRTQLLSLFSTPDGYKQYLGSIVNEYADRILENGSLTEEETAALFDTLYAEGSVKTEADEVFREARNRVRGAKIYVPEKIKHEFGDDWRDFQRRAFGQGILLTNNPSDQKYDVYHMEIASAFPSVFDQDDTDPRSILESIVNAADIGKGKTVSLRDYGNSTEDGWAYGSREEQQAELRKTMEEALREFADQAGRESYSLSEQTKSREYDEAIDLLDRNELPRDADTHIQVLEHTPRIYIDKAGAKDRRVVISWESAYLAMKKNGEQPGNYHNLGPELMKQIPQKLASPEYVVIRPDGRINAILEMRKKNRPILVSVEMEAYEHTRQIGEDADGIYNLIVTVMDASQNYLKNNVFAKGRIVENKNKEDPAHFISRLKLSQNATMSSNDLAGTSETDDSITRDKVKHKFSEDTDAEYMAAAEAGDTETAQRMVDEAAKKAGYTRRMWHGAKKGKNFTVFRGWSYFTENKKYAERYTGQNPENLYGVYAKIEHPFDTRTDRQARRDFESAREEYGMGELGDRGLPDWTDGYDIVDYIEENGRDYDAVVLDEGGDLVNGEPVYRGESYVIRDSAQVKSADPVTYDDNGNVIPLSQRFNPENDDIRFSLKGQTGAEQEAAQEARTLGSREVLDTPALKKLGVKVSGSVGDYGKTESLIAKDRAAKSLQKEARQAEKRLRATDAEKEFANGITAGIYREEDIPKRMNKDTVMELADYYWAMNSANLQTLHQLRADINAGLRDEAEGFLAEADIKPISMIELNERTPERAFRKMFGEKAQEITKWLLDPVRENEAEKIRWYNKQMDAVRKFTDSKGKSRELTREESALTMRLMEGRAAADMVAGMETKAAIENAAANIRKGGDAADAAREFSLSSEERDLAEKYAGWLDTQEELKTADSAIVEAAAKKYAELFDDYYGAINDFLVAHGYEPIGYIKGYAPHMQPEENQSLLEKAFEKMGINAAVTELPASIAGQTAFFKPNKRWNPYFLQRNGSEANYDIVKAYQSYVDYMADILYHTDDIMRVRQTANWIRQTYAPEEIRQQLEWARELRQAPMEDKQRLLRDAGEIGQSTVLSAVDTAKAMQDYTDKLYERISNSTKNSNLVMWLDNYANILAGKQSFADRGWEYSTGRKSLNLANKLNNAFQKANVAGNLSSILNQTAQLPMIYAELGERDFLKAVADLANRNTRVWAQDSDFLTAKEGKELLYTDNADKFINALFAPAGFMDHLVSTVAVRGAFNKAIRQGASYAEAMQRADAFGQAVMGSRAKGSRPLAYESKGFFSKMVHMFQIEAVNSWDHLVSDLPREIRSIAKKDGKGKAAMALAGLILRALIGAFTLNRLTDELYGGTPAPFDVLGLTANFVASGKGLSTNAYIRTIIDNTMEKMGQERLFGTEAMTKEDFDLEAAADDLLYNVMNDVPLVRNAAGMLGLGDQTVPLPGAGGEFKNLGTAVKNLLKEGVEPGEIGNLLKAMGLAATQIIPGGRQISKTAQGAEAIIRGGSYNGYKKPKLQYPLEGATDLVKALLFGKNATNAAKEYWAAGGNALTEKQTALYTALASHGVGRKEAYDAIQKYRGIANDDALTSYERGKDERALLAGLGISDEDKLDMYRELNNAESKAAKFRAIMDTGLSFDQVMTIQDKYAEIDGKEGQKAGDKAKEFYLWVDNQDYTAKQKTEIKDQLKYFQSIPAEAARYDKLTASGLSPDMSAKIDQAIGKLEPEAGKADVSDTQKWLAAMGAVSGEADQKKALQALMTEEQYAKYQKTGVSPTAYVNYKAAVARLVPLPGQEGVTNAQKWNAALKSLGTNAGKKDKLALVGDIVGTEMTTKTGAQTQWAKINRVVDSGKSVEDTMKMVEDEKLDVYVKWMDSDAKAAGVKSDTYLAWREKYSNTNSTRDENGKEVKGQAKKDKILDYIDGLNLTREQKDTLFLEEYKESGLKDTPWHKGGGKGSGSYAMARIPTLRLPDVPKAEKPSSGLRIRAAAPAAQAPRSGLRIRAK